MIPQAAPQAQIKALSRNISPQKQRERLTGLKWSLLQSASGSYLLGDIGPVFKEQGETLFKHPILVAGVLELVSLPVSHDLLLIGASVDKFDVTIEEINQAQTELSREFFVSSLNTNKEQHLVPAIGARAGLVSAEEAKGLIDSEF